MHVKLQKKLLRMTRYTLYSFILQGCFYSFALSATTEAQTKKLNEIYLQIELREATLIEAFSNIEKKTDFTFAYRSGDLPSVPVSIASNEITLYDLLMDISFQSKVAFRRVNGTIHVKMMDTKEAVTDDLPLPAIEFTVSGRIIDEEGEPLPGATVVEKGTANGTVSDFEGQFTLTVADANAILVISYVGYLSEEYAVNGQSSVEVNLTLDVLGLQEIIVVGYGTQRKRDVTGAVSSIKTEDIQRAVTTTADEFLQGRVAGVVVNQSSNAPGGGIDIRIRGTNSFGTGNEPLFIVDGIPINNSGLRGDLESPTFFTGGTRQNPSLNPLSTINPQDIESIEVLKDASATAIYGSRAANGVVLITTKRGFSGQSVLEFSASVGVQEATLLPDLLDARQWMQLNNDARVNSGLDPVYTTDDLNNPANDTDWQDELYRSAIVQNYQILSRGGSDKTQYAFSGGYFNQQGVIEGMDLERFSARLNLDQQSTSWLKVGSNVTMSRTIQDVVITEGGDVSVTRNVNEMVPLQPVTFGGLHLNNQDFFPPDGGPALDLGLSAAGVSNKPNPMFYANRVKNEIVTDRVLAGVFGELQFTKDLKFRTTLGADVINQKTLYFAPSEELRGVQFRQSSAVNSYRTVSNLSIQNQLSYAKQFGDHNVSATVVHEAQTYRVEGLVTLAQSISNFTTNFNYAGDDFGDLDKRPSTNKWALDSYLGRINYSFKDRYLFTLSGRNDGSSRFGPGNRREFFPSFSAGWILSDESFFDVRQISNLKLRFGWGRVGNSEIGTFEFVSTSRNATALFGVDGITQRRDGLTPRELPNEALQWEPTRQVNIGVDVGFLQERFTLSANYYDKLTTDLLFRADLPRSSGFQDIRVNVGEVSNTGWELELGGFVVNSTNLTWHSSFNYSRNKNEVLRIDGLQDTVFLSNGDRALIVGEPLNTLRGYRVDGLFQVGDDIENSAQPGAQPGERRYVDVDGDRNIDDDDRVLLGSTLPVSSWGFTNTFSYKGLELSIFLQGLGGMEKFNELFETTEKLNGRENASQRVEDRWTPENPNTDVERAVFSGKVNPARQARNDRFIEDASFWRLKNVSLSYNFPKAMISRMGVNALRLSLSGQNLATFTDFTDTDPEAGASQRAHPLVRTYTLGLNVTF